MENEVNIIENYGILASISWNSNNWKKDAKPEDIEKSNYGAVNEHSVMHEDLNFGTDIYPVEDDGYYIGYTPNFNKLPNKKNSENVAIVFFASTNYTNSIKSIVGFYGFPVIANCKRSTNHPYFKKYDIGNIKAYPDNIIYLDNHIAINSQLAQANILLPEGNQIGRQGFNYLNSDNVRNIIDMALKKNPDNSKLKAFVFKNQLLVKLPEEVLELQRLYQIIGNKSSNTLKEIYEIEDALVNQKPEIKERLSKYIERGAISNLVKKMTGYKCLLCEAMHHDPYGFKKINGDPYVETHHVIPVATGQKGVLSRNNLITVCANHHRQLHYGNAEVLSYADIQFVFKVDEEIIKVDKIQIPSQKINV